MSEPSDTILFAVSGMSPAILTETVWALAHEPEPVIPHRVIVVTTAFGRSQILRELFEPVDEFGGASPWESLRTMLAARGHDLAGRLRFGATGDDIRVFTATDPESGGSRELDDIQSPEDNADAADFILEQLRAFTENPDTQVVASIAGGRKTMGALLYAGLSLLGRPTDRLTHVLVNEPFDHPGLRPRFYFPGQGSKHHLTDRSSDVVTGSECESSEAQVKLADVPFVRLRDLFPRELGRYPGSFNRLVEKYAQRIADLESERPVVELDAQLPGISVNGSNVIEFGTNEFAYYSFLVDRCRRQLPPYGLVREALDDFRDWLPGWIGEQSSGNRLYAMPHGWATAADDDDLDKTFRNLRDRIRKKLVAAELSHYLTQLLPKSRRFGIEIA